MKHLSLTACAALFYAGVTLMAAQAAEPIKALMITGGCCHDYEHQKKILSEGITARANVVWTIVHEGDNTREHKISVYSNPDWAKGYDVIVHNECFGFVDDDAFVEGITAAHKAGVPAVMLHCSEHSYRKAKTDEWRKCLGISSFSHEKAADLEVKVLKPEHPVLKGFPAVWPDAGDELYKNEKLWPDMIPLAQAFGKETQKDHVVIWLNTYGKARVFVTTLGHQNATMQSEVYLNLVSRGLLWACDKLDDNGNPKSGYGPLK